MSEHCIQKYISSCQTLSSSLINMKGQCVWRKAKYWQTPHCSWQIWLDARCDWGELFCEYKTRWYQFSYRQFFLIFVILLHKFGQYTICLFLLITCLYCLIGFPGQKDLLWINIAWVVTWYYMQAASRRINQFGWDMGVNYPAH